MTKTAVNLCRVLVNSVLSELVGNGARLTTLRWINYWAQRYNDHITSLIVWICFVGHPSLTRVLHGLLDAKSR